MPRSNLVTFVCLASLLGSCALNPRDFDDDETTDDDETADDTTDDERTVPDAGTDDNRGQSPDDDDDDEDAADDDDEDLSDEDDTDDDSTDDDSTDDDSADDDGADDDGADDDSADDDGADDDSADDDGADDDSADDDSADDDSADDDDSLVPVCGDGVVEATEQCDDQNTNDTDGCADCNVTPGWRCSDEPSVCAELSICSIDNGGCDALTACDDTGETIVCGDCPPGYSGTGATACQSLCNTGNGGCDTLTTCDTGPGGVVCGPCPAGYTGTGATGCASVCATDNGGCDPLTTCDISGGAVACGSCPLGYAGTGSTGCVSDCDVNNGGCDPLTACSINSMGVTCAPCPAGHTGTGLTGCISECTLDNGGCDPLVSCDTDESGVVCGDCPTGYTGTGDTACVLACDLATDCGTTNRNCECVALADTCVLRGIDLDGDGVGNVYCIEDPTSNDCDDFDPDRSPDEPEICDGIDNNCDGDIDEGFALFGSAKRVMPNATNPQVAWSPESKRFGIVWQDVDTGSNTTEVHMTLMSPDGTLGDTTLVSDDRWNGEVEVGDIAWGTQGTDGIDEWGFFGVVFRESDGDTRLGRWFQEMGPLGYTNGPMLMLTEDFSSTRMTVAHRNDTDWRAFWEEGGQIIGADIDDGYWSVMETKALGSPADTESWPSSAQLNSHVGLVFQNSSVALQSHPNTFSTVTLTVPALGEPGGNPFIAANEEAYGVAWNSRFRAFNVNPQVLCDPIDLPPTPGGGEAAGIAGLRDDSWVVLYREDSSATTSRPYFTQVGPGCVVTRGPEAVEPVLETTTYDLASGDGGFALVWSAPDGATDSVFVRLLGPNLCDAP